MNNPQKLSKKVVMLFAGFAFLLSVTPSADAIQQKSVRAGVNTRFKKKSVKNISKSRPVGFNAAPSSYPIVPDNMEIVEGNSDKGLKEASKLPSGPVSYIKSPVKRKKISKKRRR